MGSHKREDDSGESRLREAVSRWKQILTPDRFKALQELGDQQAMGEELVETLRAAILDSELSYNEIGRQAGVDPSQVMRFAKGERDLMVTSAAAIAAVLGLEWRQKRRRSRT